MANNVVTTVTYGPDTLDVVTAAMETTIEAIDTTKTLHLYDVYQVGPEKFRGVVVHIT